MSDESRRILEMLAQGKITVAEAEQLFKAIGSLDASADSANSGTDSESSSRAGRKHLRVVIQKAVCDEGGRNKQVNVRVPLSLIRSGIRLAALIPGKAGETVNQKLKERGFDIDLSRIEPAKLEDLLTNLGELTVDLDGGKDQVRIFCE